jgi:hypothetical protein
MILYNNTKVQKFQNGGKKKLSFLDYYEMDKGMFEGYNVSDEYKLKLMRKKLAKLQAQGHFLDTNPETLEEAAPGQEWSGTTGNFHSTGGAPISASDIISGINKKRERSAYDKEIDSLSRVPLDSLTVPREGVAPDSIPSIARDSISTQQDSIPAAIDSIATVDRDTVFAPKDSLPTNRMIKDSVPAVKDTIVSKDEADASNKPNGSQNTVAVEDEIVPKSGGEKSEGDKKKQEAVDTSKFNTKGVDAAIAIKILGNDKYDAKLKGEMLDVARWQTRHSNSHQLTVDGMWGTKTQKAYENIKAKKKVKSTPAVEVGPAPAGKTSPTSLDEYSYTDKMGHQYAVPPEGQTEEDRMGGTYDYDKGGIMYQTGGVLPGARQGMARGMVAGGTQKAIQDANIRKMKEYELMQQRQRATQSTLPPIGVAGAPSRRPGSVYPAPNPFSAPRATMPAVKLYQGSRQPGIFKGRPIPPKAY